MKTTKILLSSLLFLLLASCSNDLEIKTFYYEKMEFVGGGGGAYKFDLFATIDSNTLKGIVRKHPYKDTPITINIPKTEENKGSFDCFLEVMKNNIEFTIDYEAPDLLPEAIDTSLICTGVWTECYFVLQDEKFEVKNREIKEKLSYFAKYCVINELEKTRITVIK